MDDLDWIRDITPIPESIHDVCNLGVGTYKLWLGDMDKNILINVLEQIRGDVIYKGNLSDSLIVYIKGIHGDRMLIDSLYITVRDCISFDGRHDTRLRFSFCYMGWHKDNERSKQECLIYDRDYYDKNYGFKDVTDG